MSNAIKQIDESINELLNIIEKLILKKEKLIKQQSEAPVTALPKAPITAPPEAPLSYQNLTGVTTNPPEAPITAPPEAPVEKSSLQTCSTNKINDNPRGIDVRQTEKQDNNKALLDMFEDDDCIFDRRRQAHLNYYGKKY